MKERTANTETAISFEGLVVRMDWSLTRRSRDVIGSGVAA